jgi:hypothetical protein
MKNKNKIYFVLGIILALTISSVGIFLLFRSLDNLRETTLEEALSRVDEIIEYNKNLSYTQQVFEHCSQKDNESEKLLCTNRYVIENYNYAPREDVYSIDDMFDSGADCKSYSIYYATLANMMGYDYAFFKTSNHMMTIVDFGRGYCVLDEKFANCLYYEER